MYIKRPQKKFQQMFQKNDLVIPVKNVLVNEKKTSIFKAVRMKDQTKSTWEIVKFI